MGSFTKTNKQTNYSLFMERTLESISIFIQTQDAISDKKPSYCPLHSTGEDSQKSSLLVQIDGVGRRQACARTRLQVHLATL